MLEWSGMINNYNNTEECNPAGKKRKASIVFADSIVDIISNEKHHQTVTKLSIRKLSFPRIYFTIILCTERCTTKLFALLCHKDCKQTRGSTNWY